MEIQFCTIEHNSEDWRKAVKLREEILRKPLGTSFSSFELEEEKDHIQIIGKRGDKILATAVLVPENDFLKMQRVVVQDQLRNRNIGSQMMEYCEGLGFKMGFKAIYCHARDSAVNFYRKNMYFPEGDYFEEDSIPHLKMKKLLK